MLHRRSADDDTVDTTSETKTADTTEPATVEQVDDRPAVTERHASRPSWRRREEDVTVPDTRPEPSTTEVVERPRWAHVSAMATLSLILGVVALAATFSGLLAPVGVVLGVIGGAFAAGGLVGASRRGVTGHSLAMLGMLCGLAAMVIGLMAIGGYLPWLSSTTDEVAHLRTWLDNNLPWIKNW
jgi:membrane-bound ClpP family serine protease